jgi:hypothetical protein
VVEADFSFGDDLSMTDVPRAASITWQAGKALVVAAVVWGAYHLGQGHGFDAGWQYGTAHAYDNSVSEIRFITAQSAMSQEDKWNWLRSHLEEYGHDAAIRAEKFK